MRLPASAHTSQPWRIHDIASDFRLLDVWALPTPGGPDDFPRLVQLLLELDPSNTPFIVRSLFDVREKLGALLGWDAPEAGTGGRVRSLRERVPEHLRGLSPEVAFEAFPATPLFLTENEFAAEIANRTVHGVLHLGWVEDDAGAYGGQMAVLVRPNGLVGEAYLAAISPFRHLIVYPALMRHIAVRWERAPA